MCRAAVVIVGCIAPLAASAEDCGTAGSTAKCLIVPQSARTAPDFTVGEVFPVYDHSMLIDIERFGLPPVNGLWRYYRYGTTIYRVDAQNFRVLEVIRNAGVR
jgi:hypothetical protein